MYYVIFVGAGREKIIETLIRRTAPKELYGACFHPVRHMKKKIKGEWTHIYETLIPGYVFIESADIDALHRAIVKAPRFKTILRSYNEDGSFYFSPLQPSEENWLRAISGLPLKGSKGARGSSDSSSDAPVIELSQVGFGENDEVTILSGPLKGREALVKKLDLHRRTASIEVDFMGRRLTLSLGIELVGKKAAND